MNKISFTWAKQMNASVRRLAFSGLRARYPDEPPEKIRRRLADILLGPDLAVKVYGPLEEIEDAG